MCTRLLARCYALYEMSVHEDNMLSYIVQASRSLVSKSMKKQ